MDEKKVMKELRQIRNLLILIALKSGATATEVGEITGIGYSNISALLPQRGRKRKAKVSAGDPFT
jgi:hypothetical protein